MQCDRLKFKQDFDEFQKERSKPYNDRPRFRLVADEEEENVQEENLSVEEQMGQILLNEEEMDGLNDGTKEVSGEDEIKETRNVNIKPEEDKINEEQSETLDGRNEEARNRMEGKMSNTSVKSSESEKKGSKQKFSAKRIMEKHGNTNRRNKTDKKLTSLKYNKTGDFVFILCSC